MKFTESALEQAIIELILKQGISHTPSGQISRDVTDVLIKDDLREFLQTQYKAEHITPSEIDSIIAQLERKPACNNLAVSV